MQKNHSCLKSAWSKIIIPDFSKIIFFLTFPWQHKFPNIFQFSVICRNPGLWELYQKRREQTADRYNDNLTATQRQISSTTKIFITSIHDWKQTWNKCNCWPLARIAVQQSLMACGCNEKQNSTAGEHWVGWTNMFTCSAIPSRTQTHNSAAAS